MIIGSFQSAGDGFAGQIRTLLLDAMIAIVPAQASDAENAPAWRVLLVEADNGIEIGSGWERRGERLFLYCAADRRPGTRRADARKSAALGAER